MIRSLSVSNFRGLRSLEVKHLGRCNLIVGRNSVGKTTVLEAVHALVSGDGWAESARATLVERQEFLARPADEMYPIDWRRLYYDDGLADQQSGGALSIGTLDEGGPTLVLERRFGRRVREDEDSRILVRWEFADLEDADDDRAASADFEEVLVASGSSGPRVLTGRAMSRGRRVPLQPTPTSILLRATGHGYGELARLWDGIALTDREDTVIEALRLIDSDVEKIVFVERSRQEGRVPLVKRSRRAAEPLRAMGEGAVRMLEIAVSLANSQGNALLIDEFENGIHYAVQPDLWGMVFAAARQLDVQVFAATHSWDCIRAFQTAASQHPDEGVLIRLDRGEEAVVYAETFAEADLAVITRQSIEVR